jgi:hypothetical protein
MTTEAEKKIARREALSKSIRFEVFKRDSFKCQYCGGEAPNVLLHVDHIEPVSKGGTNDITNLITSCEPCNNGKSDRHISDHVAVNKSRVQLDELQARREQLELMMEWRKGLRAIKDEALDGITAYWNQYTPGSVLTETGRHNLAKLLQKFSIEDVCTAMDVAARSYLKFEPDGTANCESVGMAYLKIGGICRVTRASVDDPDLKELFYIRGILRNRITGYFEPNKAMDILRAARSWGVELEDLKQIALRVKNWSHFRDLTVDAIEAKKSEGADA